MFARLDAWLNRLYGWQHNPLYQSGTLVVLTLLIMLVTGLYLLLFYRIGAPAESVARITGQAWSGRWIRSLHRYSADLAVVAAAVHALRMYAQGRSWGPRALAWVSGLFLVFLLYVCGWTGYVMVWDAQGHRLAAEGARLLDALPLFSAPIPRAFSGEAALPSPFFFLNLFLHIAIPIGMAGGLWLHVSRVARPVLLPPKPLLWGTTGLLLLISVAWPFPMYPVADLLDLPGTTSLDLFYSFWLPVSQALPAWGAWLALGTITVFAVSIPWIVRPKPAQRPGASVVESRFCTGCEQCYVDCPYDAIRMIPRDDGRDYLLAAVDPALCVSCGICAGSCAPMGVGPPLRTGRDQLGTVRSFAVDILDMASSAPSGTGTDQRFGGGARPTWRGPHFLRPHRFRRRLLVRRKSSLPRVLCRQPPLVDGGIPDPGRRRRCADRGLSAPGLLEPGRSDLARGAAIPRPGGRAESAGGQGTGTRRVRRSGRERPYPRRSGAVPRRPGKAGAAHSRVRHRPRPGMPAQ